MYSSIYFIYHTYMYIRYIHIFIYYTYFYILYMYLYTVHIHTCNIHIHIQQQIYVWLCMYYVIWAYVISFTYIYTYIYTYEYLLICRALHLPWPLSWCPMAPPRGGMAPSRKSMCTSLESAGDWKTMEPAVLNVGNSWYLTIFHSISYSTNDIIHNTKYGHVVNCDYIRSVWPLWQLS